MRLFLIVNSATTSSATTPTTASIPTSTSSSPSIHMQSSYPLGISDELLCELCKLLCEYAING